MLDRRSSPGFVSRSVRLGFLVPLLLFALVGPAAAQTPLQLLDRVDGLGEMPREGTPLPESTRVVLLPHASSQAHTLPNADVSREELSRRIVDRIESEGERPPLGPDGTTPWTVAPTAPSGAVYYLLAQTPDGTLYESYVNTGRGFVPGFDAVQSGRMTMGPVPGPARPRMRSALRVGRESRAEATADTSADPPSSAPSAPPSADTTTPDTTVPDTTSNTADSDPTGPTASDAGAAAPTRSSSSASPASSAAGDSSAGGGIGGILLGVLGGALLGGGGAWWWLSVRLRRVKEERATLQRALRSEKNKAFRSATGMGADSPDDDASELERLREETAALRERNETLKTKIAEIKEHLRTLREAG